MMGIGKANIDKVMDFKYGLMGPAIKEIGIIIRLTVMENLLT